MAGLWSENHIPGGKVPHTVYCLMTEQLKRSIAFDRFWFESENRPHAFTKSKYLYNSNIYLTNNPYQSVTYT